MPVVQVMFGVLLLLLGGSCTLLVGAVAIEDPASAVGDAAILLSYWLPLGLAPLAAGYLLMRQGLRRNRARRTPSYADTSIGKDP